jgi:zinc protease
LSGQYARFLSSEGLKDEELTRAIANRVNGLPGRFESGINVLNAMISNDMYRRPDDYYVTLADKYRAVTAAGGDQAIRAALDANRFTWIVVGDAAVVKPQLDKLGIPVKVVEAR